MKGVNIKKLAEELNISAASVSRALRDSHEISQETKARVWALAKQLNYEPNPSASNLRSHKSKTIAVIIPQVANSFFSLTINGIEKVARERDYHVLIYQTHDRSDIEIAFINRLLNGRVDGILISVSSSTVDSHPFTELAKNIPVVFFDRLYEDMDAPTVTTDDYESCYKATQHLIDSGCRNIAYLAALNNLMTGRRRMAGYMDAMKANHISHDDRLIVTNANNDDQNFTNIKNLLLSVKPDGIVSSVEEMVIPCYEACNQLGVNIPGELKIISFSNLKTAPLLQPSLSTVTQPALEIGQKAAEILFRILDKKHSGFDDHVVLESVIIPRASTGG